MVLSYFIVSIPNNFYYLLSIPNVSLILKKPGPCRYFEGFTCQLRYSYSVDILTVPGTIKLNTIRSTLLMYTGVDLSYLNIELMGFNALLK